MSRLTTQELLERLAKASTKMRKTTVRLLEGHVGEDNTSFLQEEASFLEADNTVRSVNLISSRLCDAGHAIDQQVRLLGRCGQCGAYVCSTPGCGFTCRRCGQVVCRADARVYEENEAYCSRCAPLVWLRALVFGSRT